MAFAHLHVHTSGCGSLEMERFDKRGIEMAKNYLIVVDMQKDFVNKALGTAEAAAIQPAVVRKVCDFDGKVIFTRDTHFENYLETSEGKLLPVEHCIKGTDGCQILVCNV